MDTKELQETTTLTPTQQAQRAALVEAWAQRILALAQIANCTVKLAIKAIEDADRENAEQQKRRLSWKQSRRP